MHAPCTDGLAVRPSGVLDDVETVRRQVRIEADPEELLREGEGDVLGGLRRLEQRGGDGTFHPGNDRAAQLPLHHRRPCSA